MREGEEILAKGCVAHNYFEFYITGMDIAFEDGDWARLERYAKALEDFTKSEPLPRTDFFIARGRALAAFGRGQRHAGLKSDFAALTAEARRIGLKRTLPALTTALAAL